MRGRWKRGRRRRRGGEIGGGGAGKCLRGVWWSWGWRGGGVGWGGEGGVWRRDAGGKMRRLNVGVTGADWEMRVVMKDGGIRRLWIGQTGPINLSGTLTPSSWWVPVEGEGWKAVGFSSVLSNIYL